MSSPSRTPEPDSLKNQLENAEGELRRRLEEACEADAKGLSTESTEEIRRLEDNLLAAATAAKQTIAVRRQMKRRGLEEQQRPIKVDQRVDTPKKEELSGRAETDSLGVREFTDDKGRPWRAWPVVPGRSSSSGRSFLGDFQNGWICFEGLGTSARRRLPRDQVRWEDITDEELRRLLAQAIDAPIREKKPQDKL